MKDLKIKGYANVSVKVVYKGDELNPTRLYICPATRYKKCRRRKICAAVEPTCTWDKLDFVGKKYHAKLTQADRAKIKQKLGAAVRKCKPVTVTLTVEEGG